MKDEAPEEIYLQWLDEDGEPLGVETTWCEDEINDTDTKYVKGDKLDNLQAENEQLANDFNYAHEKKKELQAENKALNLECGCKEIVMKRIAQLLKEASKVVEQALQEKQCANYPTGN